MGIYSRWLQMKQDARRFPTWRAPAPTARSIARHNASRQYTARSRVKMSNIDIDATGAFSTLDKAKIAYMGKAGLKGHIRREMVKARKDVQDEAVKAMKHKPKDPRKAAKGVQMLVYKGGGKNSLGGNLNMLKPRKNEETRAILWSNVRKRGKRRVKRHISAKTRQMDGYYGKSRYMVLHWIDAGAHREKRGDIAATNFFTKSAKQALTIAQSNIMQKVREMVKR